MMKSSEGTSNPLLGLDYSTAKKAKLSHKPSQAKPSEAKRSQACVFFQHGGCMLHTAVEAVHVSFTEVLVLRSSTAKKSSSPRLITHY